MTTCFDAFEQCVLAVQAGELIEPVSAKDKEFHFQNWFQNRLRGIPVHFEGSGRNTYPDFSLVETKPVSMIQLNPAAGDSSDRDNT